MFERVCSSNFEEKCNNLFRLYNRCAKLYGFRKALKLTPQRRKAMAPLTEYSRSDIALFIIELRKARAFFQKESWFDFDWVIIENNFVKVMEGKYSKSFDFTKQTLIKSQIDYKEQSF